MSSEIDVGSAAALADGEYLIVELDDGERIAIIRRGEDYFAIEDVCSHDGGPLLESACIETDSIICGRHGARFCLRSGKVLRAPAYEDLRVFSVRLAEGRLYLQRAD